MILYIFGGNEQQGQTVHRVFTPCFGY